ncbi:PDZ domain-containing protein [Candidatus Dependentiae bacterium]|nr:PDZ domain-containing protein [Candidatus Dependentiae bacterium]
MKKNIFISLNKIILLITGIFIFFSCSKPVVVNQQLDLSPLKKQNFDIFQTFTKYQQAILVSQKNNDITDIWGLLSESYKIREFNNVIEFMKSSWSSYYSSVFTGIAKSSISDIKFLNNDNATLTLINETSNEGRPIFLVFIKENSVWKFDNISGINPSNELYNQIISDLNNKKEDFTSALNNLVKLVEENEYGSAYQFSMLLLKKYSELSLRQEHEIKSFINAIMKISNFYIYSFYKTEKKSYLLDTIQLLENLFKLSYYDNRIFYTAATVHLLNNNLISANIYFDRALQFVKPSIENSEYIKTIMTYIIDIHLIQNEWNTVLGKLKIWEEVYSDFTDISAHIKNYIQNWNKITAYNCADINLKYRIIYTYKSENFKKTDELIKSFIEKYDESFYKNNIELLGCMTKYFLYASEKSFNYDNLLKQYRDYSYAIISAGKNEYIPLIISLLIESYLKEDGTVSDYNNAYMLVKQFQEKLLNEKYDPASLIYFRLSSANTYKYLKYWKKAIDEYAALKNLMASKQFRTFEEENILKLINTILEKQVNLGYLAYPYLGIIVEQGSIYGNLIIKKVINSEIFVKDDVLLEINNIKLSSLTDYQVILNSLKIGTAVKVKILREGKIITQNANVIDKL